MEFILSCLSNVSCAKDFMQMLSGLATFLAATAALYWFLFTRSFRRRIQFDLDLQILDTNDPEFFIAEMMLIVENKGQREHRLYSLLCEARQSKLSIPEDQSPRVYFPAENIVPKEMEYYFVSADVKQTFTRAFKIPKSDKVLRLVAVFDYGSNRLEKDALDGSAILHLDAIGKTTHSVSRLFPVATRQFSH